jgi:hemoglobin/transferrin/lactoferrin receptor protein
MLNESILNTCHITTYYSVILQLYLVVLRMIPVANMKKEMIFLCALLLFTSVNCFSQKIKVIDSEELNPISDVAVTNESRTKFTLTNRSGIADISSFGEKGIICFQHFTFERLCLNKSEIKKAGYEIKLSRKFFAIQEFVISANRWEQNKNEVPNKITTILNPVVELQNSQTAADLIGISDEVFIQKSQLGGGSPMIRGFATNRVLIVVDGVRMNNAIYREGNIQNVISLDPSSIESTEIIFGPGATIYGSDAIGGVMDFHTKKALFTTGNKIYIKADAFTRFASANKEKTNHFDMNIGSKKIAFLTSITYSDFGNLKMGSRKNPDYIRPEFVLNTGLKDSVVTNSDPNVQIWSGYSQLNTMNKLRFKISENIDVVFANHYSGLSDIPRYDRLIQYKSGKLRYGEWYYGPQVWMMNSLHLTIKSENKLFNELSLTAAYQNYKESRHDRNFGSTSINEQYDKVGIVSVNIDFDKKLKSESQLLYYGIEYVNNDINSFARARNILNGSLTPSASRYPDGKNRFNSISAYSGYKNNISEKLTFNTGVRYNYVTLNSTIIDNSFFNVPFTDISMLNGAITGAAGFVLKPVSKIQINLNTSTGFRAPNLDDVGKIFDPVAGIVVVPNPGLKPEYAYNIDLGVSTEFADFLYIDITGFYTWLNNAMVRHDFLFNGEDSIIYKGVLSKVQTITNAAYARVYGITINLQVNITDWLSIRSALNITKGNEKGGIPLRHAAPVFGSTHLIYTSPKLTADIYSSYNGAKKYEDMPPSETEKPYMYAADKKGNPWSPGWITMNMKVSYTLMKWAILNAGIENITNLRYRPYSSGIVAPGRNYIISLRVII